MTEQDTDSRTIEEILYDAGLTRAEWQKARAVVEGYWKDFAEINGWTPRPPVIPPPLRVQFPLRPDYWVTLHAPSLMTEKDYECLVGLLDVMKVGLVIPTVADDPGASS